MRTISYLSFCSLFIILLFLFRWTIYAEEITPNLQIINYGSDGKYEETSGPDIIIDHITAGVTYSLQIGDEKGSYDKYGKLTFKSNGYACVDPPPAVDKGPNLWFFPNGGIPCSHESGGTPTLTVNIIAEKLEGVNDAPEKKYWLRFFQGDAALDTNTRTFTVVRTPATTETWQLDPPSYYTFDHPITATFYIPTGDHIYTITLFKGTADLNKIDTTAIVTTATLTAPSSGNCTWTNVSGFAPDAMSTGNNACSMDTFGRKFSTTIDTSKIGGSSDGKEAIYQLFFDRNPPDQQLTGFANIKFSKQLQVGISLLLDTPQKNLPLIDNFLSFQPVFIQAFGCPPDLSVDFSWKKDDGNGKDEIKDIPVNKDGEAIFAKGSATTDKNIKYDLNPFSDGAYALTATCKNGGTGTTTFTVGAPPVPPSPLQLCQTSSSTPGNCNTALGTISTDPGGFISSVLGILLSVSGMIALYLIIRSGYQLMTSRGNPEAIQAAKERLVSAIVGLLFIIFSLVIMSVIGIDLLKIPGFSN